LNPTADNGLNAIPPISGSDMHNGLIVLAHGSRDPLWEQPLRALQVRIQAELPACRVELAFFEIMAPSLAECVEALWQRGCRDIAVLPALVAAGSHLRAQLPLLIDKAGAGRANFAIRLLPALGDIPEVQDGVVQFVKRQLGICTVAG
jgi:sirohydrochlorin cobaltochelatase